LVFYFQSDRICHFGTICIGGVPVKNSFSAGPDLNYFYMIDVKIRRADSSINTFKLKKISQCQKCLFPAKSASSLNHMLCESVTASGDARSRRVSIDPRAQLLKLQELQLRLRAMEGSAEPGTPGRSEPSSYNKQQARSRSLSELVDFENGGLHSAGTGWPQSSTLKQHSKHRGAHLRHPHLSVTLSSTEPRSGTNLSRSEHQRHRKEPQQAPQQACSRSLPVLSELAGSSFAEASRPQSNAGKQRSRQVSRDPRTIQMVELRQLELRLCAMKGSANSGQANNLG